MMLGSDHVHPRLVVVTAGQPDAEGRRAFSSGLLIAPRLVLTARHGVVLDDSGRTANAAVRLIAGPRGSICLTDPVPADVFWFGAGDLDAALLRLPESWEPPDGFMGPGLLWGEPIGIRPVEVTLTGFPRFAMTATASRVETETARGTVDPGTYTGSDRYAADLVSGRPEAWSDWAGMSGGPMRCGQQGHLIGVVAWSDQPLQGRRLSAIPVRALLADIPFREAIALELGSVPELEPVELAPYLARQHPVGSLGGLLRADAQVVEFAGRERELDALEQWRDQRASSTIDVKALAMTGPGGQGKTRLALEFMARSKPAGWVGGLLHPSASPAAVISAVQPSEDSPGHRLCAGSCCRHRNANPSTDYDTAAGRCPLAASRADYRAVVGRSRRRV